MIELNLFKRNKYFLITSIYIIVELYETIQIEHPDWCYKFKNGGWEKIGLLLLQKAVDKRTNSQHADKNKVFGKLIPELSIR